MDEYGVFTVFGGSAPPLNVPVGLGDPDAVVPDVVPQMQIVPYCTTSEEDLLVSVTSMWKYFKVLFSPLCLPKSDLLYVLSLAEHKFTVLPLPSGEGSQDVRHH